MAKKKVQNEEPEQAPEPEREHKPGDHIWDNDPHQDRTDGWT